ncbi:MAG: CocE/NonD family hydrolase, partial [Ktedonobacterales bacterium]|nr:CocE/NonD family hydrolase [Ktedonobacterales bacterium]
MLNVPPFGVRTEFDVPATMRDGTILRANVFRPDDGGAGQYPVLLTRTPYGKDLPLGTSGFSPPQIARLGYIIVVQDVRGCFSSGGEWLPFLYEGMDGADTVAWAAALPGSDGQVGTFGGSYVGFTQWAAAREGAPALRALAPAITWADGDQGVFSRNGVLELGTQGSWTMLVGIDKLLRRYAGQPEALGRAMYMLAREYDA